MEWGGVIGGMGCEGGWGVDGDEDTLERLGYGLGKTMARGTVPIPRLPPVSPSRVQRLPL